LSRHFKTLQIILAVDGGVVFLHHHHQACIHVRIGEEHLLLAFRINADSRDRHIILAGGQT